jgi:hypothetical protein
MLVSPLQAAAKPRMCPGNGSGVADSVFFIFNGIGYFVQVPATVCLCLARGPSATGIGGVALLERLKSSQLKTRPENKLCRRAFRRPASAGAGTGAAGSLASSARLAARA